MTEGPRLYITDDKGVDHEVGKPKYINMNETEYWVLCEIMDTQKCKYKSHGFNESFTTKVTTPSGDVYELNEFMEHLTSVVKIIEEK